MNASATTSSQDDQDQALARWRDEFPLLASGTVHLANCSHGPASRRLHAAVLDYLAGLEQRGLDWDRWLAELERCKAAFARLINADPATIAISTSVSAAVSAIANALDFSGGRDTVLTTELEFPTVGHVWLASERQGTRVRFVRGQDGLLDLEDLERQLDRSTAIVSVTQVHYVSGGLQDLAAIVERAHAFAAPVLVDAFQGLGTVPVDVARLGIDVLVSGTNKFLLGVPGIAFIYVRPDLIEQLRPTATGWQSQRDPFAFETQVLDWADDARRLDMGTGPIINAYASAPGLELIAEIGVDRIAVHCRQLTRYALDRAAETGLRVAGPADPALRGAIIAIETAGADSHQIEQSLAEQGILVAARGPVIRLAPHFFTTTNDIDRALAALRRAIGPAR